MFTATAPYEIQWKPIAEIVQRMLNQQPVSRDEWQRLFSLTNNITSLIPRGSDVLLISLKQLLTDHCQKIANTISINEQSSDLILVYGAKWNSFTNLIDVIFRPFASINTSNPRFLHFKPAIEKVNGQNSVVLDMIIDVWNLKVFETVKDRLLSASDALITNERLGQVIDASLVVAVRESFVKYTYRDKEEDHLSAYSEFFVEKYIQSCRDFYADRSFGVFNNEGIAKYVKYASEKFSEEIERADRYLDRNEITTYQQFTNAAIDIFVGRYKDELLTEAKRLIETNDCPSLRTLYGLLKHVSESFKLMRNFLFEYIKAQGLNDMKANAETITTDCEKYVEKLLSLFARFSNLIEDAFCDDVDCLAVRDRAFQEIVNNTEIFSIKIKSSKNKGMTSSPESVCPELLASYCDLLLRTSALTKRLSSDEIDASLNNVLFVLKYVSNKDVFMAKYKSHLSRRLVLELSADRDKEENMVNKLRNGVFPPEYIAKFSKMLQDIEVTKDFTADFKKSITGDIEKSELAEVAGCVDLKILNAGAWSRGCSKFPVSFQSEINELIPEMEEFYKQRHESRKVTWAHSWSSSVVTFASNKGKYELELSGFQMAVLFAWNDCPHKKISFEGLRTVTELPDGELKLTLLSLVSNPRVKSQVVLTDCEKPISLKNFNDSTMFWINHDFAIIKKDKLQQRGRVALINRVNMDEKDVDDNIHEEILRLRELRIQEAIVKIMKMRRVINHIPLHNELIEMLRFMFVPTRRLIKLQIEWLIENGYIRRDESDEGKYIYIT